jgi:hypothetical protein
MYRIDSGCFRTLRRTLVLLALCRRTRGAAGLGGAGEPTDVDGNHRYFFFVEHDQRYA